MTSLVPWDVLILEQINYNYIISSDEFKKMVELQENSLPFAYGIFDKNPTDHRKKIHEKEIQIEIECALRLAPIKIAQIFVDGVSLQNGKISIHIESLFNERIKKEEIFPKLKELLTDIAMVKGYKLIFYDEVYRHYSSPSRIVTIAEFTI